MAINNLRARIRRFFNSKMFSALFLLAVLLILGCGACYVTELFQEEPDFGGMIIIRQANMDINGGTAEIPRLTRTMILKHITSEQALVPLARKHGWDIPYRDMLQNISVKERLSARNSFIIIVNTGNSARSRSLARALTQDFREAYRQRWSVQSRKSLRECVQRIQDCRSELADLKTVKRKFQKRKELRPLNTEIEMKGLNEQLVEAQKMFMEAYGSYVGKMEGKRAEMQLELDLARRLYTENDVKIKNLTCQLAELDRQCAELREKFSRQKPDLYRLSIEPQELPDLPVDVQYFYDNIQSLQQVKLALMIDSIIEDKEKTLEREEKKEKTLERLLESKSCDVFIREVR